MGLINSIPRSLLDGDFLKKLLFHLLDNLPIHDIMRKVVVYEIKKVLSIGLTMTLVLTLIATPVSAAEIKPHKIKDSVLESAIQLKKDEVFANVYKQLEAQDATVLFDVYKEILSPQIEEEVRFSFGNTTLSASDPVDHGSQALPYGGLVTYLTTVSSDYQPTEVAVTYLDYDNSYYFVLSRSSFTIKSILTDILGYVPYLGSISSLLVSFNSYSTSASNSAIMSAGGYA